MLEVGYMNKYRLANETETEFVRQVCLRCGRGRSIEINKRLPRPNTTRSIPRGLYVGDNKLACFLGDHDWRFEWEVEKC